MTVLGGDGWTGRLATDADNPALCRLFRQVHVPGALDIAQERDPDFFALPRLHADHADNALDVWAIHADGGANPTAESQHAAPSGCGSIVVRPGFVQGQPARVAYLADLRFGAALQGKGVFREAYTQTLTATARRHGVDAFYTVVFGSNQRAMKALTGTGADQPKATVLAPFQMTSVFFFGVAPKPKRQSSGKTPNGRPAPAPFVRPATDADIPRLAAFLAGQQQTRQMGYAVDEAWLRQRLATWPGLHIGDFLVALAGPDRSELVGCVAPWDSQSVKRTRVLGYHGKMAWVRRAVNLAARVYRAPTLPQAGDCFRFRFLTHFEVADAETAEGLAVAQALLRAAYDRLRGQGDHFMSAMVPVGSPLEQAFKGYRVDRTPMTLLSVTLPGSRWHGHDLRTLRPGFEMALS